MRKKIYYVWLTALALLTILLVPSCTELVSTSHEEILADGFSPSDEDVAAITAAGYTNWRKVLLFWDGYWRVQENCADEVITPARPNGWVDGGKFRRMHRHTWTSNEDITNSTWPRAFAGVADCNRIIYQIESGFLPLEDAAKNATIAELRVLRASYYYVLCDMYGNVPIVTAFDVPDGFLPEYNTQEEVYNFMVKEITESLPYLPTGTQGIYYARFNQWAARTLLAKIYLNAEVYSGTAHWEDCMAQCDSIISSNAFVLEDDQKNVFITENQDSKEIIFGLAIDRAYMEGSTTDWNGFDIHMQTLEPANQATYNISETPWGGMCAIPQFINTFDPEDSRLTKNFIIGQQYSSSGDSLFCTFNFTYHGEDDKGKPLSYDNVVPPIDSTAREMNGYRFGKFEYELGASNIINNDYPLLRYADVLMMKAECLLRTGNADEAATIVTQVRTRAFKSNPSKATVTGAQLQETSTYKYGLRDEGNLGTTNETGIIQYGRFLDELGWEFNQEGRRRQDMIRFGVFTTKSWLSHPAQGDDHTELYPIPLTQLDANSNLKQNPGY